MASNEQGTVMHACKCLNVQLRSSPPPSSSAESGLPSASGWSTIFVAQDEDIKITYPHLTLRSRHRAPYIPDPTRCARYTTLTCLACKTLVYRIHQAVSIDDEVSIREGPIVLKGWAETEVLRSSSGWLELAANGVLVGESAVRQQKTLPQFSDLFGIILPAPSASPSLALLPDSESSSQSPPLPKYQLPPIPPIFPEPKSTSSLYAVLAAISTHHSSEMRTQAEEYIDGLVNEKVNEIQRAEASLKRSVQILLQTHGDGVKKAEQEYHALQGGSVLQSVSKETAPSSSPTSSSTPVFSGVPSSVIRDFVPMRITPSPSTAASVPAQASNQRSSRPQVSPISGSLPRVSALSASLATSSFHHPNAQARDITAGSASTSSTPAHLTHSSDTDSLHSLQSASSATLTSPQDVNHVFQFRRNVNDDINTAASLRYFQIEEEMERREIEKEKRENRSSAAGSGAATVSDKSSTSAKGKSRELHGRQKVEQTIQNGPSRSQSHTSKAKGKRKVVTFDVQVDEPEHVQDPKRNLDTEGMFSQMLFDLEDEPNDGQARNSVVLPLIEPANQLPSSSRPRSVKRILSGNAAPPLSFSYLRPASLPAPPAHIPLATSVTVQNPTNPTPTPTIGPPKSNDTNDTKSQANDSSENTSPTSIPISEISSPTRSLDRERNANILNLVGASLPSHRAAWAGKDDRAVYETFLRGAREDNDLYEEEEYENDEYDDTQAIHDRASSAAWAPSSVSVGIPRSRGSKKKAPVLSLASYHPALVLPNNVNVDADTDAFSASESSKDRRLMSSEAIRRAAYAERDVERGIDPGALDYVAGTSGGVDHEDNGDGSSSADESVPESIDGEKKKKEGVEGHDRGTPRVSNGGRNGTSGRGRDRAHKILESQAKSGVPDDGMWRSLI
ncbi:hypothetical protein D9757_001196 [Collybiopsis confluens]|uniref:Uncharacterized protein n=1 Tax=Collybiopsis confluens TaxID=2823264 RepID=A0A8H5MFY6_9AGAR|nr:hypothetical protein D9757_001196 [Collybiopsis confluens]